MRTAIIEWDCWDNPWYEYNHIVLYWFPMFLFKKYYRNNGNWRTPSAFQVSKTLPKIELFTENIWHLTITNNIQQRFRQMMYQVAIKRFEVVSSLTCLLKDRNSRVLEIFVLPYFNGWNFIITVAATARRHFLEYYFNNCEAPFFLKKI